MFHRLLNRGGDWYRPAHLDPAHWQKFNFSADWVNLNKMFNLRQFYCQIAPPFSKYAALRTIEMEKLHDDITYFHVRRSWTHFVIWVAFTLFFVDWEGLERPERLWRSDAAAMNDIPKVRFGHTREEK
jgi:hypothetical protein